MNMAKTTGPLAAPNPAQGWIIDDIRQALSLRKPQADSLEILAKVSSSVLADSIGEQKSGGALGARALPDLAAQLEAVQKICPSVKSFDRDFCSLCFALATGVGKTRLMGAFIAYLHEAHGIKNFVVIAPNLTIYEKLITDFTPGSPKYVFSGIGAFAGNPPIIITGETYQSGKGVQETDLFKSVVINIFNIAKLTAKDKGHFDAKDEKAKVARIRRLIESIGESYFNYLASRDDLVVLMDEAHRYRADAGAAAINELKPVLGIELTATPREIRGQREIPFNNIAYEYTLAEAMMDGFVKEPAIATRKGFNITEHVKDSPELERLKLNDGALIHENTKAALANWAQNHSKPVVKPFMLVVAADKAHADELQAYMESDAFRKGAYKGKIVKVYSGMGAAEEEKMVGQLLEIEKPGNPVEIVIHVNKLSEGWDVTNLYTIVPLRAANSVNLVEQSIGRGLRLPYGERTGEEAVDTLAVVSHDHYAEIIAKAKDKKMLMFKSYILGEDGNDEKKRVESIAPASRQLAAVAKGGDGGGLGEAALPGDGRARTPCAPYIPTSAGIGVEDLTPAFGAALEAIQETVDERAGRLSACDLTDEATFKEVVAEAVEQVKEATGEVPDKSMLEKACQVVASMTIFIPKVFREPKDAVVQSFDDFDLDEEELKSLNPIDDKLKVTTIRTGEGVKIFETGGEGDTAANHLTTLIGKLRKMDEIDYDGNSGLVAKLAQEAVESLERRHTKDDAANIMRNNMDRIAVAIRDQLLRHAHYDGGGYEFKVTPGCQPLGLSSALIGETDQFRDFAVPLREERGKVKSMVFTGFKKCLYEKQKFESEPERMFAVIVDRSEDVVAWFRPQYSGFSIRRGNGENYFPDFVVETTTGKYICEVKADNSAGDADVIDKADAAIEWCRVVSEAERGAGRKEWRYVFIKEIQIDEALEFDVAVQKFTMTKTKEAGK